MPFTDRIFREENGKRIIGTCLPAFINNGGSYFLTEIKIYADGMIDCWGLVDFATFKQKVAEGWVATRLPEGADVSVSLLCQFRVSGVSSWKSPGDFIDEVADEIEALNNRPTTSDRCRAAYAAYQKDPVSEKRFALKTAYEAIPKHLRRFVLHDMDLKDGPIRNLIYPKK